MTLARWPRPAFSPCVKAVGALGTKVEAKREPAPPPKPALR
jgi:hypothetical protein